MYIGTSLGGCLRAILAGEVSEDEVMFIVTRTNAPTHDRYIKVVEEYHATGNPYAHDPNRYEINSYPLEDVVALANRLWYSGKIHQPRTFEDDSYGYRHPVTYGDGLWLYVAPLNRNTTPAVKDAWEKYKLLDSITT